MFDIFCQTGPLCISSFFSLPAPLELTPSFLSVPISDVIKTSSIRVRVTHFCCEQSGCSGFISHLPSLLYTLSCLCVRATIVYLLGLPDITERKRERERAGMLGLECLWLCIWAWCFFCGGEILCDAPDWVWSDLWPKMLLLFVYKFAMVGKIMPNCANP